MACFFEQKILVPYPLDYIPTVDQCFLSCTIIIIIITIVIIIIIIVIIINVIVIIIIIIVIIIMVVIIIIIIVIIINVIVIIIIIIVIIIIIIVIIITGSVPMSEIWLFWLFQQQCLFLSHAFNYIMTVFQCLRLLLMHLFLFPARADDQILWLSQSQYQNSPLQPCPGQRSVQRS